MAGELRAAHPTMPPSEQARWFSKEVQPHEPALRAYLLARFPSLLDCDDLIQETYIRLVRANAIGKIQYPKAFLFTTARNVALDFFRRRRVTPTEEFTESNEVFVLEERLGVEQLIDRQKELEVLTAAVQALPERCRQVLMLRYIDGFSYKEIAARLGISPETVKVQLVKGMRRCAAFFATHGILQDSPTTECGGSRG
jgi:RNA polymerase sigma factor (sigma-70 family)